MLGWASMIWNNNSNQIQKIQFISLIFWSKLDKVIDFGPIFVWTYANH